MYIRSTTQLRSSARNFVGRPVTITGPSQHYGRGFFYLIMQTIKSTSQNVDRFNDLYGRDRFKARIFCFENSPQIHSLLYNNEEPGKFQVFSQIKKFGVSKTLKLYASKKSIYKLIVNKTTFYRHERNRMMPITLGAIEKDVKPFFIEHFSWVRFLDEYNLADISFNSIVNKKLYSRDKVLRHMYGCGAESALKIRKAFTHRDWKIARKNIHNIENFNADLISESQLLIDGVVLAYKLNESINAAWSVRRLKEEHDKWSKIYTEAVLELSNRTLHVHPIFQSFNNDIGGGLLGNTTQLAIEGKNQRHCVASYSNNVDSGKCAIFHIDGYTAEIINTGSKLILRQFRGYRNKDAPDDIRSLIEGKLLDFNATQNPENFKHFQTYHEPENDDALELPF